MSYKNDSIVLIFGNNSQLDVRKLSKKFQLNTWCWRPTPRGWTRRGSTRNSKNFIYWFKKLILSIDFKLKTIFFNKIDNLGLPEDQKNFQKHYGHNLAMVSRRWSSVKSVKWLLGRKGTWGEGKVSATLWKRRRRDNRSSILIMIWK